MWGILFNILRRYRILPLFLRIMEKTRKNKIFAILGKQCGGYTMFTNAVNKSSISGLTHLHVWVLLLLFLIKVSLAFVLNNFCTMHLFCKSLVSMHHFFLFFSPSFFSPSLFFLHKSAWL